MLHTAGHIWLVGLEPIKSKAINFTLNNHISLFFVFYINMTQAIKEHKLNNECKFGFVFSCSHSSF